MSYTYKYKALNPDGTQKIGIMTAENESQVKNYLADHKLLPVSIEQKKPGLSNHLSRIFNKTDHDALILFTNSLRTAYSAGIPILRALSIIKIGPEGSRFNDAIEDIRNGIRQGKSLSQAMAKHDDIFSTVYINSIGAGEESGKLDDILTELSIMLEKDMEITRLVKSGLRYPMIVMILIAAAFIVLMTFVMPKFIDFYSTFNAELPLPSQVMILISNFITNYWPILLVGLGLMVIGVKAFRKSELGRNFIDTNILKIPIFGKLIIKGNVTRFALMLRILFKSGLPIVTSLEILSNSIKNRSIGTEIKKIEELFKKGAEGDIVSDEIKYFPDMSKHMMAIGLETGSLDKMLFEISKHYSGEVEYTSRHLTSILEPILTLIVAIFVLLMALAIFLPMWNLIKVFNG